MNATRENDVNNATGIRANAQQNPQNLFARKKSVDAPGHETETVHTPRRLLIVDEEWW